MRTSGYSQTALICSPPSYSNYVFCIRLPYLASLLSEFKKTLSHPFFHLQVLPNKFVLPKLITCIYWRSEMFVCVYSLSSLFVRIRVIREIHRMYASTLLAFDPSNAEGVFSRRAVKADSLASNEGRAEDASAYEPIYITVNWSASARIRSRESESNPPTFHPSSPNRATYELLHGK